MQYESVRLQIYKVDVKGVTETSETPHAKIFHDVSLLRNSQ